ncbi:MAG: hypothetical protein HA496_05645 [Thaumarchaeota archaeon]|jgi:hypothetical protein|nr:hypothetical protein [Nitrososphaerota archaeon]
MVRRLPDRFLKWAYFDRVRFIKSILDTGNPDKAMLLIESTRHNPALCTARIKSSGIELNAKIVGAGFVPKQSFLEDAVRELRSHVEAGSSMTREDYAEKGLQILLRHVYFESEDEANRRVDFTKIATLEIGAGIAGSSRHTWENVQSYRRAVMLYYMPPNTSFEVRGMLDVLTEGNYFEFVNLAHDAFHYTPVEKRVFKPCYILNVEEVYDNSATQEGFGRLLE